MEPYPQFQVDGHDGSSCRRVELYPFCFEDYACLSYSNVSLEARPSGRRLEGFVRSFLVPLRPLLPRRFLLCSFERGRIDLRSQISVTDDPAVLSGRRGQLGQVGYLP